MISSLVIATKELSNPPTKVSAYALAPQIVLSVEALPLAPINSDFTADFAVLILLSTLVIVSNVSAILSETVKVILPVPSFSPAVTVT